MKRELKEFQELMHWNNEELIAQFHYAMCIEADAVVSSIEAEYDYWLNEYYSDFDAEMMRENLWITKHC